MMEHGVVKIMVHLRDNVADVDQNEPIFSSTMVTSGRFSSGGSCWLAPTVRGVGQLQGGGGQHDSLT